MSFIESEERQALRKAVRELGKKYGYAWFNQQARSGGHTTELWLEAGKLGTTARDGGARQLTVAGHPLYTFVGDSTPGQTNGQGINLNGGVWTVVSPGGAPVTAPNPAGPSTQKPLASGY